MSAVMADPGQLRGVCCNLLDNAIKSTEAGGRITISACSVNGMLTIAILDSVLVFRSSIFRRFLSDSIQRELVREALGSGLALCQSIVKGLGGTIRGVMTCVSPVSWQASLRWSQKCPGVPA